MAFNASLDYNNRLVSRLSLGGHQQQQQQQHPHIQPHAGLHVDEQDAIDDSIEPALISPASMDERRESYANSAAPIFSPQSSSWEDFAAPPLDRTQSLSNGTFFEQNGNHAFARPQLAQFGHQPSWPLVDRSANPRNPFGHHTHDIFPANDYDATSPNYVAVGSNTPAFHGVGMASNVRPSSVFSAAHPSDSPLTTSPDKWNPINGAEVEPQPLPKRLRHNSPSRPFSPGAFARRDGIRKKNARFEIPVERNLHTIDQLISEATNEDDIKELKQQKRLLRNRQAALDSRQRKKKHTEELEEEKKQWNERYSMLETDIDSLRIEREQFEAERVHWEQRFFQQQQQLQGLQFEKEELVAKHTLETGELRKKINFLADQLEKASNAPATVTPASTEFADFGLDINGLCVEGDEWNSYIQVDQQFGGEQDHAHPPNQQQASPSHGSTALVTRSKQQQQDQDSDKPVASGLLFMLLLCGAFVASKASGTRAPLMPPMPEDVRAASATVLDSLLKDASSSNGNSNTAHSAVGSGIQHALEPGPSGAATTWQSQHKATLSGAEFASLSQPSGLGINGVAPSTLDQLHQGLTAPTDDQQGEQLFGMTPAQYNSLTSPDFHHRSNYGSNFPHNTPPMSEEESSPMSGRKNLAATLQRMRQANMGDSAAEVYTRSLLWDRVPTDVVREFKRMVEESNKLTEADQAVKHEN